jgi:opacity protein-like surface antigen
MQKISRWGIALALALALPVAAHAQDGAAKRVSHTAKPALHQSPSSKGFNGNIHLNVATLNIDDAGQYGMGVGGRLGYGLTQHAGVYLGGDFAQMDLEATDYQLGNLDLGLQYTFGQGRTPVRSYVNAALSGTLLGRSFVDDRFDEDGEAVKARVRETKAGAGFTLGGGLKVALSRSAALDLGVQRTFGDLSVVRVDGKEVPTSTVHTQQSRLHVGFTFGPGGR